MATRGSWRSRATAGDPALIVLIFLGGALSFVYVFQVYQFEFWRTAPSGPRSGRPQQAIVGVLALLTLSVGLWPEPLLALSRDAAAVLGAVGG